MKRPVLDRTPKELTMSFLPIQQCAAPEWAKAMFSKHLPVDDFFKEWKIHWFRSSKDSRCHGNCHHYRREINVFMGNDEYCAKSVFLVLHEIAHGIRGKIMIPFGRRNDIHHDEKFFRIAATLYLEYGLSILDYACEHEYRAFRWIMVQIRDNPSAFGKDPDGFHLEKPKVTMVQRKPIEASGKVGDKGGWWRTWDYYEQGEIIKINRVTYTVKTWGTNVWRVPISQWQKSTEKINA